MRVGNPDLCFFTSVCVDTVLVEEFLVAFCKHKNLHILEIAGHGHNLDFEVVHALRVVRHHIDDVYMRRSVLSVLINVLCLACDRVFKGIVAVSINIDRHTFSIDTQVAQLFIILVHIIISDAINLITVDALDEVVHSLHQIDSIDDLRVLLRLSQITL